MQIKERSKSNYKKRGLYMKKLGQLLTSTALAGSLLIGAVGANAQTQRQAKPDSPPDVFFSLQDPQQGDQIVIAGGGIGYKVLSSEMSFDIKTVKGSPFSATATSESVQ